MSIHVSIQSKFKFKLRACSLGSPESVIIRDFLSLFTTAGSGLLFPVRAAAFHTSQQGHRAHKGQKKNSPDTRKCKPDNVKMPFCCVVKIRIAVFENDSARASSEKSDMVTSRRVFSNTFWIKICQSAIQRGNFNYVQLVIPISLISDFWDCQV